MQDYRLLKGPAAVAGRVMIAAIFLSSAIGNKIVNFQGVATGMGKQGIWWPEFMLVGAIVFLIAGSLSIVAGYQARLGAVLLLVFLVLATYFYHDFWTMTGAERQGQMIQFMKNLALMGTMLFVIANGAGVMSLDARRSAKQAP